MTGCTMGNDLFNTRYMQNDIKELKKLEEKLIKKKDVKSINFVYTPREVDIRVGLKDNNLVSDKVKEIFLQIKDVMTSDAVLDEMESLYGKNGFGHPPISLYIGNNSPYKSSYTGCPPGKNENEIVKYKYWGN